MEIAIQSSDELEQLRTRLRKMSETQLVSFGKAARSLCRDPKCPEVFKRQLEEAKTEWRQASESAVIICARRKPEAGRLPRARRARWTEIFCQRTCKSQSRLGEHAGRNVVLLHGVNVWIKEKVHNLRGFDQPLFVCHHYDLFAYFAYVPSSR